MQLRTSVNSITTIPHTNTDESFDPVTSNIYCSGLIFTLEKSIIQRQFEQCIPTWI